MKIIQSLELKELSQIPEYTDGVRLMIEKNFEAAEESFIQSLTKLQQ
jgi:hypothetical protein